MNTKELAVILHDKFRECEVSGKGFSFLFAVVDNATGETKTCITYNDSNVVKVHIPIELYLFASAELSGIAADLACGRIQMAQSSHP